MNANPTSVAAAGRILAFLARYRNAGLFAGSTPKPEADGATTHNPQRFVDDLEALGPTFIKLGQALSTRPDIVSQEYMAALARMQNEVTPSPWPQVRERVESELGTTMDAVFAYFDPVPLGSASLAQVHEARLHDGRRVAVKVQRPGVETDVARDLSLLESVANGVDHVTTLGQRVRFCNWVHEFRRTLTDELDYRLEAANLDRFAQHLRDYPELVVPRPVHEWTRPRVLVMELVCGVRPDNLAHARFPAGLLRGLCESLMRGYLDQIFVHGEIHADPHPGNLLITAEGRMAVIDLGMVAHLPPRQRTRLLKVVFHAVEGRGDEAADEVIELGTRLEDFDEERYLRESGQLIARYAAHSGGEGFSEGRLLIELVRVGAECGLRSPPELGLLGRAMLNLEGVCANLAPAMRFRDVFLDHFPRLIGDQLRRTLSPSAMACEAIEAQTLLLDAPRKVSAMLSLLAENRLQVRMTGLDNSRLIENLQKIANRITAGAVIAALILASALLLHARPGALSGALTWLAMVLFVLASGLGLALVVSALRRDRKASPTEERGPRIR